MATKVITLSFTDIQKILVKYPFAIQKVLKYPFTDIKMIVKYPLADI